MLMVLFDPGLNGTPNLSSVDLPTLAEDGVFVWCFQAKVILYGLKETSNHPR
jgi:hypothetical protein